MLIGLVTKRNLMVANQLREQGKPKLEAILEASEADATYSNDKFGHFIGSFTYCNVSWGCFYSRIGMGVVIVL
jgi:hypothetical protein